MVRTATTYRAWRTTPGGTFPLDIGEPDTLADALNEAKLGTGLAHKDGLYIHAFDARTNRGTLHSYIVVKKAAQWPRDPITGLPKRVEPLDFKLVGHPLAIDDFEPRRPFDALRDDATGFDRTLVENG